ncbi:D-serine deaminase, pyridoxal phosphate-dependent [Fictibacillus solisalsi]|uniref:D-serine deaminase, pyridoxal phosphate-dependent n=1 Tax=Fictibacillus solisalsi TaxID=459525 RepID=A0A1G9VHQ2_9BACL|nr:alanine racemase [Fictibacillus solisalsi]SDM71646.1 D-serine deaminase, pyridoxal phosphate-dependent [Fictibacillus solisalsi]
MDTPVLVIERKKLEANIQKMADIARTQKVHLRPHTKTHKNPQIAKLQLKAGAAGITVAKVSEAEVMAEHGINDIFIAYPLVSKTKIQKAIDLSRKIRLITAFDSLEGVQRLSQSAETAGVVLEVRMEIDSGLRRTGVLYDEAVELARKAKELPGIKLTGIYTFRGPIVDGKPTLDIEEAGRQEGQLMADLAERLRAKGVPIIDVSVGSTSTSASAAAVEGITEIRPGTYVFYDRMQEKYHCCSQEECAAAIHVTVVSKPSDSLLIVDGGSKTFATDVQPVQPPIFLNGFGEIKGHPEMLLERLTEEHGMVEVHGETDVQIGDVLQIIPNHICSTVNLHNDVFLKNEDGTLEKQAVLGRGKLQ